MRLSSTMRAVALVASVVSSLALPVSVPIGDNLPDASRFAYADEAKKGELTFSDINILQLTDVHSWLSGHKHEIGVEATYDTPRQSPRGFPHANDSSSGLWFWHQNHAPCTPPPVHVLVGTRTRKSRG